MRRHVQRQLRPLQFKIDELFKDQSQGRLGLPFLYDCLCYQEQCNHKTEERHFSQRIVLVVEIVQRTLQFGVNCRTDGGIEDYRIIKQLPKPGLTRSRDCHVGEPRLVSPVYRITGLQREAEILKDKEIAPSL